ncbi:MAG: hypothetical protein R3F15_19605 [Lysobacterales bacterium]
MSAVLMALLLPGVVMASPAVALRDVDLAAQSEKTLGCASMADRLYCWGPDPDREVLDSLATWTPRPDSPTGRFNQLRQIAVSDRRCVLDADGVWCWGLVSDTVPDGPSTPERVRGIPDEVQMVAFGRSQSCAVTSASGLWCWGSNELDATQVSGLPDVLSTVALGGYHGCTLVDTQVWCWGSNTYGQVGNGATGSQAAPAPVSGLPETILAVAAGFEHSCAIDGQGDIWCWGNNDYGQLGMVSTGSEQYETAPVRVAGLGGSASSLHLGVLSSCALVDGEKLCWGYSDFGLLGSTPVAVPRPLGSPPDWLHGCFSVDGELRCPSSKTRYPHSERDARPLPGLPAAPVELALGRDFACARLPDGAVWCWGLNDRGQLGQGDTEPRDEPVRVPGLSPATDLTAGAVHVCAATADSSVWCWGENIMGALGDGTTENRYAPVLSNFTANLIAAGSNHTCGYGSAGLHCWGLDNQGQVSGVEGDVSVGAMPLGAAGVHEISAGGNHSCAVIDGADGQLESWCWGRLPTTDEELGGVDRYVRSPRPVVAGAALAGRGTELLQSIAGTACLGDLCYGSNYLPPDRGQLRVSTAVTSPIANPTDFVLGGRLLCVQGVGSDVRCASLIGVSCAFEGGSPNMQENCRYSEMQITAAQRDWVTVVGLPATPRLLAAGEQYACAVAGEGVWCWGTRVPLEPTLYNPERDLQYEAVYRAGAVAPEHVHTLMRNPEQACPAYAVSTVELVDPEDPVAAGAWGQSLVLEGGRRLLHGGLNFGGYASPDVPGYAAFAVRRPDMGQQSVTLTLIGDGEYLITMDSIVAPSSQRQEVYRERLMLSDSPTVRTIDLDSGYHTLVLYPGTPLQPFLVGAQTTQLDGSPAAFQDGAVVGGVLQGPLSGFSAICTDDAEQLLLRTQGRSELGPGGAGDLRAHLFEGGTGTTWYDSEGD